MNTDRKDRAWEIYRRMVRGAMLKSAPLCGWQLTGSNYISVVDPAAVQLMLDAGLLELKHGSPWTVAVLTPLPQTGTGEDG